MTTYYVDPAAGGADDGSSWTDAWTDVQSAFDTAAAGDVVYCRGTQTLSAAIDVDTNDGDESSGYIKFVGCNAGGNNDGTRFVLDGNSAASYCLNINSKDYLMFENIECKNATSYNVYYSALSTCHSYINCSINNSSGEGIRIISNGARICFLRCSFYGNGSYGIYTGSSNIFLYCSFHDNTGSGLIVTYGSYGFIKGCLIYDNGNDGIENLYYHSAAIQNVINGNVNDGISCRNAAGSGSYLVGNRITNHSGSGDNGINFTSRPNFHGWNYLEDNDTNYANSTIAIEINDDGTPTNQEDQADTNEGYTSKTDGSEDFNLRSDATLRRTAIQVPLV